MNKWKWLYPGLEIKRWIILIILGFIMISTGFSLLTDIYIVNFMEKIIATINAISGQDPVYISWVFAILIILLGMIIVLISFSKIEDNLNKEVSSDEELIDILYEKKLLEKGPEIVSLGGGTGLSNLLRGLKKYTRNITAIVTVADDGGSSGRLRDELNILPPGDIRNCLVALADIEPLMKDLIQYRFEEGESLAGHSFGNLFIASMRGVVGDFEKAVKASNKVLAIKGQVLPATNKNIQMGAEYEDGSRIIGESDIPKTDKNIKKVFLKPAYCEPTEDSLSAILQADIITVGPGSLFTSILPNLLVNGIVEKIKESEAIKIYICNVMTEPGETTGFTAGDHLKTIYQHIDSKIFDYIIVNQDKGSEKLLKKYEEEGAYPVEIDEKTLIKSGAKVIKENLLTDEKYLRHNPEKTAKKILKMVK